MILGVFTRFAIDFESAVSNDLRISEVPPGEGMRMPSWISDFRRNWSEEKFVTILAQY